MVQTQIKTRVRAALACRIVNLDRVKFNDAVASGTYPCAPMTMKGSARIFTEEQLLPLFFFARLTEFGIPTGRAGQLACEMASAASSEARSRKEAPIQAAPSVRARKARRECAYTMAPVQADSTPDAWHALFLDFSRTTM